MLSRVLAGSVTARKRIALKNTKVIIATVSQTVFVVAVTNSYTNIVNTAQHPTAAAGGKCGRWCGLVRLVASSAAAGMRTIGWPYDAERGAKNYNGACVVEGTYCWVLTEGIKL